MSIAIDLFAQWLVIVFQCGLKVIEIVCVDGQWHIDHCPPISVVQCFILQKHTWIKCFTKINTFKTTTGNLVPHYFRFWVQFHIRTMEHHKHWICLDDLSSCVGGITRKYTIIRLKVPNVWPIQQGINLTQKEMSRRGWVSFRCPTQE
jgi:hypothetical protein